MASNSWRAVGTANVLGFLRSDLKHTTTCAWIIGPWIDAFFAQIVVDLLPAHVELRIVTRPVSSLDPGFREHAMAASICFGRRPSTTVKLLSNLHAKLMVIDQRIVYCGSANWYRYSLLEGREIVLRGPVEPISGLLDEIQVLWDEAITEVPAEQSKQAETIDNGYMAEVIDPVAQAKLNEVPGSFVIRRHSR
jgi:hypothetical protein